MESTALVMHVSRWTVKTLRLRGFAWNKFIRCKQHENKDLKVLAGYRENE